MVFRIWRFIRSSPVQLVSFSWYQREENVMTDNKTPNDEPRYKVQKVIQQYDLNSMGTELESRWLGEGTESSSLRDLAAYFNCEVLKSALNDTERPQFNGGVKNIYRLLTDDNVSRGEQIRVQKSLEREDINVERLTDDFVTHQAIHTYLTKGRDVEKSESTGDRLKSARKTIHRLRSRLIAVSETTLSNLRETNVITLGSFDVFVNISVHCTDCGSHMSISELFNNHGCECNADD